MVNTPAEEGGAGCSHGRVKININCRSSFTRQLVNRVPHPIFCSVCVSCFIKFGRLRVSCVPPPLPRVGGRGGGVTLGPTESQFVLPRRSSSIYSCPPSAGWRLGAQYHLPAHTQKPCVYPPSHWSALLVLKTNVIVILRVGFDHQHAE